MYPTLFRIGPIGIYSYGLMMAFGFLSALYVIRRELGRRGIDPDLSSTITFAAIIGGIVGAKLLYVLVNHDWSSFFSGSGLAWYGGLTGGLAAVLLVLYRDERLKITDAKGNLVRRRVAEAVDAIGPSVLLGQAFGRMGCFLSGDGDYGPPTNQPWGIEFPHATVPSVVDGQVIRVQPTMLYDVALLAGAFLLLWMLRRRWDSRPGVLSGLSLILLGLERFVTEFWRLTDVFSFTSTPMAWESRSLSAYVRGTAWKGTLLVDGISEYQLWSILAMAIGGVIVWQSVKRARARAASASGQDS